MNTYVQTNKNDFLLYDFPYNYKDLERNNSSTMFDDDPFFLQHLPPGRTNIEYGFQAKVKAPSELKATIIPDDKNISSEKCFSALPESGADSSKEENDSDTIAAVHENIIDIFRDGQNVAFEAGMESNFGLRMEALIIRYSEYVINILFEFLNDNKIDIELLAETLRVIGFCKNASTRTSRFNLLIASLKHSSPIIRDSAALGLADMDNSKAIPYLHEAIRKEPYSILQNDFAQIIEELGVS